MSEHFMVQIQAALDGLSQGERKVAEFVLATPDEAMRLPLAKIAEATGVSEPTVLRCCRKLGCDSLQDFRIKMASAGAIGLPATHAEIAPGSSMGEISVRVLDFTISNLDNLRRELDSKALQRAVEVLAAARSIHFWGNGASGIVARDAQQKAPLFGVPCIAETDSHQILINTPSISRDDVVVAISNTGRNSALMPSVAAARANGATVIALTSSASNALALASDLILAVPTLDNTDVYTPTISRIAALCVVDMLAIAVAQTRDQAQAGQIRAMKQALVNVFRVDDDANEDEE